MQTFKDVQYLHRRILVKHHPTGHFNLGIVYCGEYSYVFLLTIKAALLDDASK